LGNPIEAVEAARNKRFLRECLSAAGVPIPQHEVHATTTNPSALRSALPCVVKPLILSASRGVIRADTQAELEAAFRRVALILASPEIASKGGEAAKQILIERFVPGPEVALEGLLVAGRLEVLALFDKPDPLEGPYFEETLYVTPSRLPRATQDALAATTARAAATLGLREGPIHAELRLPPEGPVVIELAARSIGGLCSRALRFGAGISLEELILEHAIGTPSANMDAARPARERAASGVLMLPIPRRGVLREVRGREQAAAVPGIEGIEITAPVGQELLPLPDGASYLGFVFARGEEPERVEAALREAQRRLEIEITPVLEVM
jgi:biotin carboxylase